MRQAASEDVHRTVGVTLAAKRVLSQNPGVWHCLHRDRDVHSTAPALDDAVGDSTTRLVPHSYDYRRTKGENMHRGPPIATRFGYRSATWISQAIEELSRIVLKTTNRFSHQS